VVVVAVAVVVAWAALHVAADLSPRLLNNTTARLSGEARSITPRPFCAAARAGDS